MTDVPYHLVPTVPRFFRARAAMRSVCGAILVGAGLIALTLLVPADAKEKEVRHPWPCPTCGASEQLVDLGRSLPPEAIVTLLKLSGQLRQQVTQEIADSLGGCTFEDLFGTQEVPFQETPRISGHVTGVETSTKPTLVLLDVGAKAGIKCGFHLTVYRGKRFVAKVVVARLLSDSSACRIVFSAPDEAIRIGDPASTRID